MLPSHVAQRIFCQLLGALRHAHAAGFVHCDVKPENVRLHAGSLEPDALHAVLLDWGYARAARRPSSGARARAPT